MCILFTISGDAYTRIDVMSKTRSFRNEPGLISQIEYAHYDADELRMYFDEAFETLILPPLTQGRSYIWKYRDELFDSKNIDPKKPLYLVFERSYHKFESV